jgi:hypothetical protein
MGLGVVRIMSNLTWKALKSEVIRIAKSSPFHVDKNWNSSGSGSDPAYSPKGSYSGCIVGQALTNLGVSSDTINEIEGTTPKQESFAQGLGLRYSSPTSSQRNSVALAQDVYDIQRNQDLGYPWGECI